MKVDKESLLLENKTIYLRPLKIGDITVEYINGLNDPEVNRYLVDVRRTLQTRKSVRKFIISNIETLSSILFGIFIKDDPRPFVGTLRVSEINFFHYSASIGICLFAKHAWKKGYALKALKMAKDYLFKDLGLHYLEAGVYAKNKSSINLFTKAVFSGSYRVKNKFRHKNSFEEVIFLGVINKSFDKSKLNNK